MNNAPTLAAEENIKEPYLIRFETDKVPTKNMRSRTEFKTSHAARNPSRKPPSETGIWLRRQPLTLQNEGRDEDVFEVMVAFWEKLE